MIDAAVASLRRRGVAGMSFTEVLNESGAARGAIYHHFPGGKSQLIAEAARHNADDVLTHLAALPNTTPQALVDAFLAAIRPVVEASTHGSGCAVAAVAVDPEGDKTLREVAATAFSAWSGQLTEALATAGMPANEAADLATTLIALLEGAHVLCRAAGTLGPFEQTARTIGTLTRAR
jgi:AcrR family transcriptional regulator